MLMKIISSNNLFSRHWSINTNLFGKKIKNKTFLHIQNYRKNICLFFKNFDEFPYYLVVFD